MKAMINLLKNEHNVTSDTPMTPELIAEYFKTPKEYEHVNLEVKDHAPLPTRKYYNQYADHMRLLMNEHNSYSHSIRLGYEREVQAELRQVGIDIRDSGLTAQTIRTSLWNKEQAQRIKEHSSQIQGYLLNDDKLADRYYAEVAQHIEQLSHGLDKWDDKHTDYYDLLNDQVDKCFIDALMSNVEMMLNANKDLHKIKKNRYLLKLKKFFFENRLIDDDRRKSMIDSIRLGNMPAVPVTLSGDIYDNIYDSFNKLKLETEEDIENLFDLYQSPQNKFIADVRVKLDKSRAVRLNGYDPYTESEYWKVYQDYKQMRTDRTKAFIEKQKKIKEFMEGLVLPSEENQRLVSENQQKFISDLAKEELKLEASWDESSKTLNDLINQSLENHKDLSFLSNKALINEKEPKCLKEFKSKVKDLLSKFVQVGILNSAKGDLKKSLEFMSAKPVRSMDMIDSVLSKQTNVKSVTRLIENVTPVINVALRSHIEQEARKILYSMNYQENLVKVLAHMYSMEINPEHFKTSAFIEMMKDNFKEDPEIQNLLTQRPKNLFMMKGMENHHIMKKVWDKIDNMISENPIEALDAFCQAIAFGEFDPAMDEIDTKQKMEQKLREHLGELENPIEDAVLYGLNLLSAHKALKNLSGDINALEN